MTKKIIQTNKICPQCNLTKNVSSFYKAKKSIDGYQCWCKQCMDERKRDARPSGWHKKHDLKKHFNMTLEEYNNKMEEQNGVCAICKRKETRIHPATKKTQCLSVDHCHKTGKIRGLLCSNCNIALGNFQDSTEVLKNAVVYLDKYKVEPTNATNNDIWIDVT